MTEIPQRITLEIHIDQENIPAIEWLSTHSSLSKQRLKIAMAKGAVWIQKQSAVKPLRRASNTPPINSTLYLYYDENVLNQVAPEPILIADQQDYSVWHKPTGMLSHGSKWGDHCAIIRWVELHDANQRTSFLIHRLDRATSGLLLIAHNKKTAHALTQQFEQRQTQKHYHAIVEGDFPITETTINTPVDTKPALSIINRLAYCENTQRSLLNIEIKTGRKHQIRQHLSSIDYPIIGDRLYGNPSVLSPDLQLCAHFLKLQCPITHQTISFTLPKDLQLSL